MSDCNKTPIFPYRVVQNYAERNSIPCTERIRGMIVTVITTSNVTDETGTIPPPFTQYMLQGMNICDNSSWVRYSVDNIILSMTVGHKTENEEVSQPISNSYLDNKYPKALEGFKVTIVPLNTTFMKISEGRWVITNNIVNNE